MGCLTIIGISKRGRTIFLLEIILVLLTTFLIIFILFVSPLQPIQSTITTKKTARKSIKFQFLVILDCVQRVTQGLQQSNLINQISLANFFKKLKT